MICFADNDVLLKLASCDLLAETLQALGCRQDEIFVLPTARNVLLKPINNPVKAKARIGEAVYDRLYLFLNQSKVVDTAPSPSEQLIFDDMIGIDPGEAILYSTTANHSQFILTTGDKKSLVALAQSNACHAINQRLAGKVICFEQIVLRLICHCGFETIRTKAVPARDCDKSLKAIFGSGLDATEENVRAGLDAYISDLRNQTTGLLAD